MLFVVDVKVVVAVVVVAVFFGWDRCTTWRRRRSDSSSCGTLSPSSGLLLSLSPLLSVYQFTRRVLILVCLFVCLLWFVHFSLFSLQFVFSIFNFQFFQRFFKTYFLELRFVVCLEYMGILSTINCMASTNTWDNNTCLSVLLLLLLWIYNLLMGVLFSFFVFVNFCVFRNGSLQHFQTLTFSYFSLFVHFLLICISYLLFVCHAFTFVLGCCTSLLFSFFSSLYVFFFLFWLPSSFVVV